MRQLLSRLTRLTLGYGVVQWSGPFLALIFTPIITRLVSPGDYGVADYIQTIGSAVGMLALLAQPQALAAHFNDQPDEAWRRRVTSSALTVSMALGLPLGALLFSLAPQLSLATFGDPQHTPLFQLIGATAVFGISSTILTAAAQAALRVRWGMALSLTNIGAIVTGNIVFLILLRLGVTGLILTPILAAVAVSLTALILMRSLLGAPSWPVLKTLAISGATLLPTMLSGWALTLLDRLFLVYYVSTEALGYYAIANKIAALAHVAMTPLYSSWMALALSIQHDPAAKERYATMARYLIAAALSVSLGLGIFATEVLIILTRPAYLPAAPYVGLLAYVHVFTGFGTVLYTSALAGKQLMAVSWTVGTGALINLILNFALIPSFGLWGATIATVVGYGVPQILLYWLLQKRYPVPYPLKPLLAALAVHFVLLLVSTFVPSWAFTLRVGAKLGLLAILPLTFLALGVITRLELQQGLALARSQARRLLARLQSQP